MLKTCIPAKFKKFLSKLMKKSIFLREYQQKNSYLSIAYCKLSPLINFDICVSLLYSCEYVIIKYFGFLSFSSARSCLYFLSIIKQLFFAKLSILRPPPIVLFLYLLIRKYHVGGKLNGLRCEEFPQFFATTQ